MRSAGRSDGATADEEVTQIRACGFMVNRAGDDIARYQVRLVPVVMGQLR